MLTGQQQQQQLQQQQQPQQQRLQQLENYSTIRAIIVEDEYLIRLGLKRLLEYHCPEVEIIGIFDNLTDAKKEIEHLKPNLVFLDLMFASEGATGFSLLDNFPKPTFEVIVVSAYVNRAIDAIKYRVAYFIEKPINSAELKEGVERVKERLELDVDNIIPLPNSHEQIKENETVYCEADGNYTKVFLKNKKKMYFSIILKKFEKLLGYTQKRRRGEDCFFRIHSKWLVNLKYIRRVERVKNKKTYKYIVHLSTGTKLGISQRRKSDFFKLWNFYNAV